MTMPEDLQADVFISHIHEEREVASALKDAIEKYSRSLKEPARPVVVFSSSHCRGMEAGPWREQLEKALRSAKLVVTLCSWTSRNAQWLMFETGGAWGKGSTILPVCHSGSTDVPIQLQEWQALNLDRSDIVELWRRIGQKLGVQIAVPDAENLRIRRILRAHRRKVLFHELSGIAEFVLGPTLLAVAYVLLRILFGWDKGHAGEASQAIPVLFLVSSAAVGLWHGANRHPLPPKTLLLGQGLLLTALSGSLTGSACSFFEEASCEDHIRHENGVMFWSIVLAMPMVYAAFATLGARHAVTRL